MNKFKIIIYIVFNLLSIIACAQMGVGTKNNNETVEIITSGDNIYISQEGKLGVGNANSITAIDLRGGANKIFAIGYTDQTAEEAGPGAIRYVDTELSDAKGYVEFSNGTEWVKYYPGTRPRIYVAAEKNSQKVVQIEGNPNELGEKNEILQRVLLQLTGWYKFTELDDGIPTNYFDASKGEFKAPRDGIYYVQFSFVMSPANVSQNIGSQNVEAIWELLDANKNAKSRIKTNHTFPGRTAVSNDMSNKVLIGASCYSSFKMKKGDILRPLIWINVQQSTSRQFELTPGYNTLTIIEL